MCAKANLHYDNDWQGFPEVLNPLIYYKEFEKYDRYIIKFRVQYKNIERSGFFGYDEEKIIEKIREITFEKLKDCIVILNKSYNVPANDIIDIQKRNYFI